MNVTLVSITQSLLPTEEKLTPEELIVYTARVSNPGNQMNMETADRLLAYLVRNKHWSPFEMVDMTVEIRTSRAIAQQILRHRSFCLGADTEIWFDLPSKKYKPYKKRIADLYDNFHFGGKPSGSHGTRMPMRDTIKHMKLRCLNEDTGEITHTHVQDVVKNTAHLFKVHLSDGKEITASKEHKFFTDLGWLTLEECLNKKAMLSVQGSKSIVKRDHHFPPIDERVEEWLPIPDWAGYYVSNMGRVKRVGRYSHGKIRLGIPSRSVGYPIISLNRPGLQKEYPAHTLVLKTFKPLAQYEGVVARHLNHNKLDNRLSNLEWGTDLENKQDSYRDGMTKQLTTKFVDITSVEDLGVQDSYDISVEGPWHNFVANGIVVHNSFQEFSQRYAEVTEMEPLQLRMAGATNRQSSTDEAMFGPDDTIELSNASYGAGAHIPALDAVNATLRICQEAYKGLLALGVAKECARMVLPLTTQTTIYMKGSIRSWIHYLQIRCDEHTQLEHREVALAIRDVFASNFPNISKGLEL